MSDVSDLFRPKSDPKHLTVEEFGAKELANFEKGVESLPALVKPYVGSVSTSIATLGSAVETAGGAAVSQVISNELPAAEAFFTSLLQKLGVQAGTAAGIDAVKAAADAVIGLVQNVAAKASAGTLAIGAAITQAAAQ